jgi:hypothetical protein
MTTHNLQLLEEYPGTVYRFGEHRMLPAADFTENNAKEVEN